MSPTSPPAPGARRRGRLLVAEDDALARAQLCEILSDEGYEVEAAADGFKAAAKLEEFDPELVLSDLEMPGMGGIDLLGRALARDPDCAFIIVTAYPMVGSAVTALKMGAADYLTKPLDLEEMLLVVERALERRRLRVLQERLRRQDTERRGLGNIIGDSPPIREVVQAILTVAPSRATVLITGESGTGKELVAAAIHERSPRAAGPLVKLHCAALSESLLESELFGHERGSFTGATQRHQGYFEQADGGTLFLDEIGEISPAIQVKLLRVLQEHEIVRVGGSRPIKVDVRVVVATNRDLRRAVAEGRFREDLFYRLNVVSIDVPPLRERPGDVPLIAAHLLERFAREAGQTPSGFTDEALQLLTHYDWPGNVRELVNAVERATIVNRGGRIGAEDLPSWVRAANERPVLPLRGAAPVVPGATMAEVERHTILKTLEHTKGSTIQAAEILDISVRTIQYRLKTYHANSPRGRGPRVGLFKQRVDSAGAASKQAPPAALRQAQGGTRS